MKINFDRIDKRISGFMNKWGVNALRYSLAIIFVWFGILKVLGISPAEKLVLATVYWLPFFTPQSWLIIIGFVYFNKCYLSGRQISIRSYIRRTVYY